MWRGGLGLGMDRWAGQKAAGAQAAPPSMTVTPPPQLALCFSGFMAEDVAWDSSVLGPFPFCVDVFCNALDFLVWTRMLAEPRSLKSLAQDALWDCPEAFEVLVP